MGVWGLIQLENREEEEEEEEKEKEEEERRGECEGGVLHYCNTSILTNDTQCPVLYMEVSLNAKCS